jgi:DNA repair exonuclease SbcCD ATPase subunit
VTASRNTSEPDGATDTVVKKYKKLKKRIKESERHNLALAEERDSLLSRVGELETESASAHDWRQTTKHHLAEIFGKDQRIETLQEQVAKLEHGFHQRGEQLIQLSRDSGSKAKLKKEKSAAEAAKGVLQTRVSGMFFNYRALLEKNDALLEKLTAMAKAGGFGHAGSLYRKELALLKGQQLEDLYEYKHRAG